jgi:prophage antirepressor-like protein
VLDLSNARAVAERLDDDERRKLDLHRQGETWAINESGLYSVILRSDKPQAKKFRKWVTSEVLPSIRKHGAYIQLAADEPGYTSTQRLGEVVELAKLTVRLMKDQKSKPADISKTVGEQLAQFGITMPATFYPTEVFVASDALAQFGAGVAQFLLDYGDIENKAVDEVFGAYTTYCSYTGVTSIRNIHAFGREIRNQTGISSKPGRRNGKVVRIYAS